MPSSTFNASQIDKRQVKNIFPVEKIINLKNVTKISSVVPIDNDLAEEMVKEVGGMHNIRAGFLKLNSVGVTTYAGMKTGF